MARSAHDVRTRLRLALLTMLCVALAGLVLIPSSAFAADPAPRLTVHETVSSSGGGASNDAGAELPENQEPKSAGAGFVYQLIRLDAGKVTALKGSLSERTQAVLSNPDAYVVASEPEIYGESDDDGEITNDGNTGEGSWVTGVTFDSKSGSLDLDGAKSATLPGTSEEPSVWYLKLEGYPTGLKAVKGSESGGDGLVVLPYVYDSGESPNFDVHVYPKINMCATNVTAGFDSCERHQGEEKPSPTPPPGGNIIDKIVNGVKNGNGVTQDVLAKTGAGVGWIALTLVLLISLGLVVMLLKRRSQRQNDIAGQAQQLEQPDVQGMEHSER